MSGSPLPLMILSLASEAVICPFFHAIYVFNKRDDVTIARPLWENMGLGSNGSMSCKLVP